MSKKKNELDPIGQPLLLGEHTLPGVWRYMLPRELQALKFPEERRSSCMSCPKSCYEGYRPDYRCCTYHPRIPNFLIGLAFDSERARPYIEQMIARGMATPEGMNSTPQQWVDYLDDLEEDRFGKSEKVLCPMLELKTGYCMVHAFRNSVCSTFFCLKDHGSKSDDFWLKLQTLGSQVEMALTQWSLRQIGFDIEAYVGRMNDLASKIQKTSSKDGQGWAKNILAYLWGDWHGRELELFQKCGALISENRDYLWDIANQVDIIEASKFDQAMVKSVPKRLEDQVDPSDHDESGETIPPDTLWKQALKSYHKLWKVPIGCVAVSAQFEIWNNEQSDDTARYYSDKPYVIVRLKGKKRKVDWRLFIDNAQKQALEVFMKPQELEWASLKETALGKLASPQDFVREMLAHKVLIKI